MKPMLTPFRFRDVDGRMLVTNETGEYGLFASDVIERFFADNATGEEKQKLRDLSIVVDDGDEWRLAALLRRLRKSYGARDDSLSYLIVIPTLRCDLSCTYYQVSRAALNASGFDWTEEHLAQFEFFLDTVKGNRLKLEFQGGEPTVRPDLLRRVIDVCSKKFNAPEFVICTNLTRITPETEEIFARPDVSISTSIDGPVAVMTANRTTSDELSEAVFRNFNYIVNKYGPDKVAALPTVTEKTIADPQGLVDCYAAFGFQSIFLRPVNYMGFACKQHSDLSRDFAKWDAFYRAALERIIDLNQDGYFEEFYLALMLRSIFAGLPNGFVDLRSPSRFASDYCVIDFDGTLYPSDEARMLSRTRTIDLSIGTMASGLDDDKLSTLNRHAINQVHPDCLHCAYMPFCGIDVVDDISRYGRTDMPKHETWFCRRQMSLFDLIFEKVAARDRRYLAVFLKWIYRRVDPPPTYELFHD